MFPYLCTTHGGTQKALVPVLDPSPCTIFVGNAWKCPWNSRVLGIGTVAWSVLFNKNPPRNGILLGSNLPRMYPWYTQWSSNVWNVDNDQDNKNLQKLSLIQLNTISTGMITSIPQKRDPYILFLGLPARVHHLVPNDPWWLMDWCLEVRIIDTGNHASSIYPSIIPAIGGCSCHFSR